MQLQQIPEPHFESLKKLVCGNIVCIYAEFVSQEPYVGVSSRGSRLAELPWLGAPVPQDVLLGHSCRGPCCASAAKDGFWQSAGSL